MRRHHGAATRRLPLACMLLLVPAMAAPAAGFCGGLALPPRWVRRADAAPAARLLATARDVPAVILPGGGDGGPAPGERRTLLFSDKSEKRALKQIMKGGTQGVDGKVGRLLLVRFDEEALAARRLLLAPEGCEVQVVRAVAHSYIVIWCLQKARCVGPDERRTPLVTCAGDQGEADGWGIGARRRRRRRAQHTGGGGGHREMPGRRKAFAARAIYSCSRTPEHIAFYKNETQQSHV